ncbi:MAG: DUF1778 domain-containing protein [Ferrimonas sp.]
MAASIVEKRIPIRMNSETKALLEQALVLSGYSSLNSFITHAATAHAKQLIEQEMTLRLNQEESIDFLSALARPRQPNPRFLRAARRYKEIVTDGNLKIR